MSADRGYQHNYSEIVPAMCATEERERKARTIAAVLADFLKQDVSSLSVLDLGSSSGIITDSLAAHFAKVVGVDIDVPAVASAARTYTRANLSFAVGDAMHVSFPDETFDVVICSHVYEHVPDAAVLMSEVRRMLKATMDRRKCIFRTPSIWSRATGIT